MGYQITIQGLTDAQERVLKAIKDLGGGGTPKDILQRGLNHKISKVMLFRHLNALLQKRLISKRGTAPLVYYEIIENSASGDIHSLIEDLIKKLQLPLKGGIESFSYLSDEGLLIGLPAFTIWFESKIATRIAKQKSKRKSLEQRLEQGLESTYQRYLELRKEIDQSRDVKNHTFDCSDRYQSILTLHEIEKIFCSDFYSIPEFGKTMLGNLIHKAKVGDRACLQYIDMIADLVRSDIQFIMSQYDISVVLWTPHTIKRPYPFLDYLRLRLDVSLPEVIVKKVFSDSAIPQKSLSELSHRLSNARSSNLIVEGKNLLNEKSKLLIIDDAIGSCATVHAIAEKVHQIEPQAAIYAYAPVGSYKGFDVIKDI